MTLPKQFPVVLAIVVLLSCAATPPADRSATALPPPPSPSAPLQPLTDDPRGFIDAPVVADERGGHLEGQMHMFVTGDFNSAALRRVDPAVQLINESKPDMLGLRHVLIRVPGARLGEALAAVRSMPGVVVADRNVVGHRMSFPNDPNWAGQVNAGLSLLNLPAAWTASRGIGSVRVAVLDGGVNEVPDLSGRVEPGRSFVSEDPENVSDTDGHGTAVASIIGAEVNNSIGIAGVAPGVHVVPVDVCGSGAFGQCYGNILAPALEWLYDQNIAGRSIEVLNMSFKSTDENVSFWLGVLDSLGVIAVASSGNGGDSADPDVIFPAANSHVVAVGGVLPNGQHRAESSYGPEIDIAAPFQTYSINNIDAPFYFEGTSAAAPVIAGLAALFKSTAPEQHNSKDVFVDAMRRTGDGGTLHGWDQYTGYGVPDAWSTIWFGDCVRFDLARDNEIDVADEQTQAYHYGHSRGDQAYDERYDLMPALAPNGVLDIPDLQAVFGREGMTCPT